MWCKYGSSPTRLLTCIVFGIYLSISPTTLIAAVSPHVLFDAVANNDKEKVADIIRTGFDVGVKNENGDTALIIALFKGHLEIAEQLISTNRNLESTNSRRSSALHVAAYKGYEGIVRMLIDKNVQLYSTNLQGNSALSLSIKAGHNSISELLIKEAAKSSFQDYDTNKPYLLAIKKGNSKVVELLLEHGVNPVQYNDERYSALHLAIAQSHIDVARVIIAYDKNKELLNYTGFNNIGGMINTPLIHAASVGDMSAINLLLKQPETNLDIVNASGDSALSIAIKHKRHEAAERLLMAGASISITDGDGSSLLRTAVFNDNYALAKMLLYKGANPNKQLKDGSSEVLLQAIGDADLQTVEAFLNAGAVLNTNSSVANQLLKQAIIQKRQSLKEKLLSIDANLIEQKH